MSFNKITDVTRQTCAQVSRCTQIVFRSSEEWVSQNSDKYSEAEQWLYFQLSDPESAKVFNQCEKINKNRYNRTNRVYKFVRPAIRYHDCCFVTLTFSDEAFNLLPTYEKRRRAVLEFFKPYKCYMFNVDYGTQNGREHFHGIVCGFSRIDHKSWKYGVAKGRTIKTRFLTNENDCSDKKLSKYLTKLSLHSTKDSVRTRITYSKIKPVEVPYADWASLENKPDVYCTSEERWKKFVQYQQVDPDVPF